MNYKFIGVPLGCGSPYPGSEFSCKEFSREDFAEIAGNDDFSYTQIADEEIDKSFPDNLKCLSAVMTCCKALYKEALAAYHKGDFPVVIGGDHSLSIGSIAAGYEAFGEDFCVVWIDAHTDIHTEESTESGYIHGMPLAASMGICCDELTAGKEKCRIKGENIFIIGARSIDEGEYSILAENNVNLYTAEEIRAQSLDAIMDNVMQKLKGKQVHISLDMDFFEPDAFYATGYNIGNGFSIAEAKKIIARIYQEARPKIFECVEYSPAKDNQQKDFVQLKEIIKYALQQPIKQKEMIG